VASSKRFSVLRDPVHGDIYLTHEELRLLDTQEMQRLRGIRQLGAAYLVFPGAVHTRFEHSIGTVHMAQKLIDSVNMSFQLDPAGTLPVSDEETRVIRIAALLHDVTHVPHGHSLEDQDGLFERHDSAYRYERMFAPSRALGRALRDLGLHDQITSVLTKPGTPGRVDVPAYWGQMIGGTIAADILDYLARDAYFTGLKVAVDERVASYFKVDRATGNLYIDLAKRDLLREDILSEIVRLLDSRYTFSERVYYHHAKVAAGALVVRAVELCVRAQVLSEEDLYDCTDESLLEALLQASASSQDQDLALTVSDLVQRYRQRKLYKRACVFPRYENEQAQEELTTRFFASGGATRRIETEARIAELVHFATGQQVKIIIYCPAQRMQLKEARIHVLWPGADSVEPLAAYADRVPRLNDLSRAYRDLWKFYVFADSSDPMILRKVQEVAGAELSGASNVYSIPS
jgi:hypothetical protein